MLKKSCCLLFHQLRNHIAQHSSHSIKSLVRGTDVIQPMVIEEDLLDNEDGYSLAELRSGFHDSEAQWDDLRSQEEVDDI